MPRHPMNKLDLINIRLDNLWNEVQAQKDADPALSGALLALISHVQFGYDCTPQGGADYVRTLLNPEK